MSYRWTEHNDAAAQATIRAFAEALDPLLQRMQSTYRVHHLKVMRVDDHFDDRDEVRILIVMRRDKLALDDGHHSDPLRRLASK